MSPTPGGNTPGLDLATLFLAAGGETDEALQRTPPPRSLLPPDPAVPGQPAPRPTNLLQLWLPEDMAAWTDADRWLSGVAAKVRQWEADQQAADRRCREDPVAGRRAPAPEPLRDAARATLATIETLPLTNPKAATWFIDAAEITGNRDLATELATTMLQERRLPIGGSRP